MNGAVNICIQIFIWTYVFILLGIIHLGVEFLGQMNTLYLTFLQAATLFSHNPRPLGREEDLEMGPVANGQWFNQARLHNESFTKMSKPLGSSESLQAGEHIEVRGGRRAWAGRRSSVLATLPPQPAIPCLVHLFHLAVLELYFLNNKLMRVNKNKQINKHPNVAVLFYVLSSKQTSLLICPHPCQH